MLSDQQKEKVIDVIRHWRDVSELCSFALKQHGYGNTDGGFGVTYAQDLDDYDREVDGYTIPKGCVEIYGFWGVPDGYEFHIQEIEYLEILSEFLLNSDLKEESIKVTQKIQNINQAKKANGSGLQGS